MGKFEKKRARKKAVFLPWLVVAIIIVALCLIVVLLTRGGSADHEDVQGSTGSTASVVTDTSDGQNNKVDSSDPQPTEEAPVGMKKLEIYEIEQSGDLVIVHTSYLDLEIPYAYSDLVQIEADNQGDHAVLRFYANILGQLYPAFNVMFNVESKIYLGLIAVDEVMPVYAEFCDPDASLDADVLRSIYAAQEVFNDVVSSLEQNEAFLAGH